MLQASSSSLAAETSEMPMPLASQTSVMPTISARAKGSSKKYAERLRRRHADGVDLAGAQQPPPRVGPGVADRLRRREHPARTSSRTSCGRLKTFEAVAFDTPARSATSLSRAFLPGDSLHAPSAGCPSP